MTPDNAAEKLAAIIYADLEVSVSGPDLTKLIRSRWNRIAPLAHAIHDSPDLTKNGAPGTNHPKPPKPKEQAVLALKNLAGSLELNGAMGGQLDGRVSEIRRIIAILEPVK